MEFVRETDACVQNTKILQKAGKIVHSPQFWDNTRGWPLELPTILANRFLIHSKSGKKFGYYLEPDFLHFIKFDENKVERLLDFRVEYIGISTGKSGNRDFGDRLKNHEKIIEISSFIQRDHPNRQIYIFGYQAQYSIEVVPDSFINSSKMLETHLPEKMKSTAEVLEACLIKHFQPK